MKLLPRPILWILISLLAACSTRDLPVQPSPDPPAPVRVSLEAEAGSGDGQVRERSRASGGQTVHLGPGERREWTFGVRDLQTGYAIALTYANGKEGPNETIQVNVDGGYVARFEDRDSGDSVEGWNLFVTDAAGDVTLGRGSHTLTIEVSGGDGCVEIDFVTLSPRGYAEP
jgi:hypothetical protein